MIARLAGIMAPSRTGRTHEMELFDMFASVMALAFAGVLAVYWWHSGD
jgi:hypothetical protein